MSEHLNMFITQCPLKAEMKTHKTCLNSVFYKCVRQEMEEHLNQEMKKHLELSTLEISGLKEKVMVKEHQSKIIKEIPNGFPCRIL